MLSTRYRESVHLRLSGPRAPVGARSIASRSALALIAAALAAILLAWPAAAAAQEKDLFTSAVEKHGLLVGGAVALLGGLGTCLTPCVYPMIAITVSIFGAHQAQSRRQAMLLSTSFVFGIVVLFTSMIVIAALTGSVFGSVLSNAWVITGISILFMVLAASMFGAFEMTLPESLMQRLNAIGGIGYGGAFLLGLVSGLIAAPCTGPVLTGIILYIGKSQNVALGAVVGSMFSVGLGIPFWLVGTFAISLPKGGPWMLGVKSFFGIVMIITALKFLQTPYPVLAWLVKPTAQFMGIVAAILVAGLALGAVHLAWDDGGALVKVRKGLGIAATVSGGFMLWASIEMPPEPPAIAAEPGGAKKELLTWLHEEKAASAKAQAEKRPLLVDFTADWCGACKEMTKETFSDPRVMEKAAHFVAVKIDATNDEDPQVDAVKGKYKVIGLPTVVIYDSMGTERKRFNEFVGPEVFLAAIEGIH